MARQRSSRPLPALVPRLVLHSCSPSTRAFPDTRLESLSAAVAFSPALQSLTWTTVARLVRSDVGLRQIVGAMSKRPVNDWWHTWSVEDKRQARELFQTMRSGSGFVRADRGVAARHDSDHVVPWPEPSGVGRR